jgi:hypothetical protein
MLHQSDERLPEDIQLPQPETDAVTSIFDKVATQASFPNAQEGDLFETISSDTTPPINTPTYLTKSSDKDSPEERLRQLNRELAREKQRNQRLRRDRAHKDDEWAGLLLTFLLVTLTYFFGPYILKSCFRGLLLAWDCVGDTLTRCAYDVRPRGDEGYVVKTVVHTIATVQHAVCGHCTEL